MKICSYRKNRQQGISVILVLFLLVVIGGMVVSMARLGTTQHINSMYSARGAQAYFAARAGLDYAIARINAGAGCAGIGNFTLDGHAITLQCTEVPAGATTYDEGNPAAAYDIFILDAIASQGSFGLPDVVNREVRATVRYP